MNILQRVATLIRANINDLIDRAEDPEKMIKQLIQDLNNQIIQVKTMVAQSLADQYMMERRLESAKKEVETSQKRAELAVDKGDDALARTALQRMNSFQRTVDETARQFDLQKVEVESLKLALAQLEMKAGEVTRERDILLARHRRAAAKQKLVAAKSDVSADRIEELLDAISGYVDKAEVTAQAHSELQVDSENRRLAKIEEDHHLDDQLAAIKAKRQPPTEAA